MMRLPKEPDVFTGGYGGHILLPHDAMRGHNVQSGLQVMFMVESANQLAVFPLVLSRSVCDFLFDQMTSPR